MTEDHAYQPAPLWRRTAARVADTCAMAVIEAVMTFVTFVISALVFRPSLLIEDERSEAFLVFWLVLLVPASMLVYWYEVVRTARFGQTLGKRLWDICVVPWDGGTAMAADQEPLGHWRFAARWAIPHVAGIVAAVVAAIVVLPRVQDPGDFWGPVAGAAAAPWALVYLSSLFDKNRRGWHDKAAGTVVVHASDDVIQWLQERAEDRTRRRGQTSPITQDDTLWAGPATKPSTVKATTIRLHGGLGDDTSEDSPSHAKESWGLVSDYYAPRRTPLRSEADDSDAAQDR